MDSFLSALTDESCYYIGLVTSSPLSRALYGPDSYHLTGYIHKRQLVLFQRFDDLEIGSSFDIASFPFSEMTRIDLFRCDRPIFSLANRIVETMGLKDPTRTPTEQLEQAFVYCFEGDEEVERIRFEQEVAMVGGDPKEIQDRLKQIRYQHKRHRLYQCLQSLEACGLFWKQFQI